MFHAKPTMPRWPTGSLTRKRCSWSSSCGRAHLPGEQACAHYSDLSGPCRQTNMIAPGARARESSDCVVRGINDSVRQEGGVHLRGGPGCWTCDSCGPQAAVHSVQNVVDNHTETAVRNVRSRVHRGECGSDTLRDGHHGQVVTAGQSNVLCKNGGQSVLNVIHNRLWTAMWKDEESSVDNGVDESVHRESPHVR